MLKEDKSSSVDALNECISGTLDWACNLCVAKNQRGMKHPEKGIFFVSKKSIFEAKHLFFPFLLVFMVFMRTCLWCVFVCV